MEEIACWWYALKNTPTQNKKGVDEREAQSKTAGHRARKYPIYNENKIEETYIYYPYLNQAIFLT